MRADLLLQKYGPIIAEEVNVKDISLLDDSVVVTITYIPLGQKLWWVFGKDTSRIIAAAKQGWAMYHDDGTLTVQEWTDTWTLLPDMYEVRYSWLQEDHQTVEWWVIISLDFTITEELKKEGVARELSRFLNQMRKDAQLNIDQKITVVYRTSDTYIQDTIVLFSDMLKEEALLQDLNSAAEWTWYEAVWTGEEGSVTFTFLA